MNIVFTLTSILIFVFSFLPLQLYAAANTYYVTQNGKGARSGASIENAMAVSDFNALSGTGYAGDTFYFSGSFTTRIVISSIEGTSGNPLTLDGYEAGDCDPINSVCTSSAVLQHGIDIGNGRAGPDHINIQDFRMTLQSGTAPCFSIYTYQGGNDDQKHSDYLTIRRNYIHETNGTMFYYYQGRYSTVQNNKFTHFGQNGTNATQGINLVNLDDFILKENEIGHDESSYPSGCISAEMIELHGCYRVLIESNDIYGAPNQSGIRPKENGRGQMEDIVIRYNKIHDNIGNSTAPGAERAGKGVYALTRDNQSISNIYIYGNLIYNNTVANVMAGTGVDGFYVWSNILIGSGRNGVVVYTKTGQTAPANVYVYNNTIARNGTLGETDNDRCGFTATAGTNINVRNNIFWNNRPKGEGSKYNQIYSSITLSSLEHNTLYHSLSNPNYYYDGAFRTLDGILGAYNFEKVAPAGVIEDSGFKDPDGADNTHNTADDDYTLNGRYINNGADLSQCFDVSIQGKNHHMCYDDALDPNATNWKTTPPIVRTTKQGDHGAWERGAYVYSTGIRSTSTSPPSGLKIKNFKAE